MSKKNNTHGNISDCSAGTFGKGCTAGCMCNDTREICNPETGFCAGGCQTGFMGLNCSLEIRKYIDKK